MHMWRLAIALSVGMAVPALATPLEFSTVNGHGGVPLVVVQTGNKQGPAILFIHGYSQSYLSWEKQLNDAGLQKDFHLIAFDLRGHSASAKPTEAADYGSEAWGGDVDAVIKATGDRKPVLVPWSYGGPVAMSYVRHHGVGGISGIDFVAAGTSLGGANPPPYMSTPEAKERMGCFMAMTSADIMANLAATKWFVGSLTAKPLPSSETEQILIYNMLTPGYVRAAMFKFQSDNKDLQGKITVPVLITHGEKDGVVPYQISVDNKKYLPGSALSTYEGIGHAPFLEASARFNAELAAFVSSAGKKIYRCGIVQCSMLEFLCRLFFTLLYQAEQAAALQHHPAKAGKLPRMPSTILLTATAERMIPNTRVITLTPVTPKIFMM